MTVLQLLFNSFFRSFTEIQEELLKLSRLRSGGITVNTAQKEVDLLQRLLGIVDKLVSGIKDRIAALEKVLEARELAQDGLYKLARTTVTEAVKLFHEFDSERAIHEINEFIEAAEKNLASYFEGFNRWMAPLDEFLDDQPLWVNFQNADWAALEERCITMEQLAPQHVEVIAARKRLDGRYDQWAKELHRRWKATWGDGPFHAVSSTEAYYLWKTFVGEEAAAEEIAAFNQWVQARNNAKQEQINAFNTAKANYDLVGMNTAIGILVSTLKVDETELDELRGMRADIKTEQLRLRDLQLWLSVFADKETARDVEGLQTYYRMFADLSPKALGSIDLDSLLGRMQKVEHHHVTFDAAVKAVEQRKAGDAEPLIKELEDSDPTYPTLSELRSAFDALKRKAKNLFVHAGLLAAQTYMLARNKQYALASKKLAVLRKDFPAHPMLSFLSSLCNQESAVAQPIK